MSVAGLESQQLVVFRVGPEEYGLEISRVQEIIRYVSPRQVSSDVPSLLGVISLRGKIIPVFDLAAMLGVDRVTEDASSRIVIASVAGEVSGLLVDGVDEVLTVGNDRFDEVPVASDRAVQAIAKLGERLVLVLDGDLLTPSAGAAA